MEKVIICYPHGGSVSGAFAKSLIDLQKFEDRHPSDKYELVAIEHISGLYISENRNHLVNIAKAAQVDWLLQIDADETFDPMLLRIIMRNANKETRPIIAGLYANVSNINEDGCGGITLVDCIYAEVEDGQYLAVAAPKDLQPFKVDAAGTGIMLTHMSVYNKIQFPWYFETYCIPSGGEIQFMNEDIAFCRKAREAGYEIWCDPLAQATHWKTLPISPSTLRDVISKGQKFIKDLEKEEYNDDIPGWVDSEECSWLYRQAKEMNSIVEVGSWLGKSTYSLLKGCKGTVYSVDHFLGSPTERETNHREAQTSDIYSMFLNNVGHFENLKTIKLDSTEAAKQFEDKSIDMIFIDADHEKEAFIEDLKAWIPKCSKLLCGHDNNLPGVLEGLTEMNINWSSGPGSIWYIKIK